MKSYKKLLMSGVALLTAFSLTACGGNDTKESSKGGSTDGKQTLTVSVDGDGYKKYIESIKGDFESENNAEVKVVVMAMTDQADALALDGPAGTGPDVFIAPYDRVGSMGSQGHLAEVTTQPEGITDTESKLVTFEGKQYGTPFVIETLVGFYNKDLISEMPKDFSEVEALTKDSKYAFTSESGKNTAFLAKWTDFYFS
ncbi:MAG: extracellular solute-binding protein, partial [Niallia sp.]